jgi:hypothetical protein
MGASGSFRREERSPYIDGPGIEGAGASGVEACGRSLDVEQRRRGQIMCGGDCGWVVVDSSGRAPVQSWRRYR